MKIVFVGPPGSGKGTQAAFLQNKFGWEHISSGVLLREEANKNSQLKESLSKGNLADPNLVIRLTFNKILGLDSFILDGFPRKEKEAEALINFDKNISKIDYIFNLQLDDDECLKRLHNRIICSHCGLENSRISAKNIFFCDFCNYYRPYLIRHDDNQEGILKRLSLFHQETSQTHSIIKEYFSKPLSSSRFISLDARAAKQNLHRAILKNLRDDKI